MKSCVAVLLVAGIIVAGSIAGTVVVFIDNADTRADLETSLANLKTENDDLKDELSLVKGERASLSRQKTSLQAEYDTMEDNRDALKASNASLQAGYEQIRHAINLKQAMYPHERRQFVMPYDTGLDGLVANVTGGYSGDVNEQWQDYERMYDWVVANIRYSYDSPLPIMPASPTSYLSWREEYWRTPSQTIEAETGDCEDMALLLASMILNYTNERYPVWIILWTSDESAHAAVAFPVQGEKLTILDPAGKYYTGGYSLGSLSIADAVSGWLAEWSSQPGTHVSAVFDISFYESFTSTSEFVNWALAR